jgi:protein-glutamine gamma-glutamyltransferase
MSGIAARAERARLPALDRPRVGSEAWAFLSRMLPFLALCLFAVIHWSALVVEPDGARTLGVTAVAAGTGTLLWLSGRLEGPRGVATAARAAIVVLGLLLALVTMGLPAKLFKPRQLDELWLNLDLGLAGIASVEWPYAGPDDWVRLSILLAAPLVAVLAAALAFWPARRFGGALRAASLVALVALYGVAVTERGFDGEIVRGGLLFLLIAAWLWLPRVRRGDGSAAAAVALITVVVAMPVSAKLDSAEPWVDYRSWQWFGASAGIQFDWEHQYGPLDWPRKGTTLLRVKSEDPHYWKVQTLDRFDGLRWVQSQENLGKSQFSEIPRNTPRKWSAELEVSVSRFESRFIPVAGTPLFVRGAGPSYVQSDGTSRLIGDPLRKGDRYSVEAYVPDPSPREMRTAEPFYADDLRQYISIYLPRRGETALDGIGRQGDASRSAEPPPERLATTLRGDPREPRQAHAHRELLDSPYRDMYLLSRRLVEGAPTAFDAVSRVEAHLKENYRYQERVPSHEYPLQAFLTEDRSGYCQQFSGAMALMLRMNGIPARVVAGFAPGSFNRDTSEFRVRDLDAHSWVEVYFTGIGWVTFDPTPPLAPPEAQLERSAIPVDQDPAGDDSARGASAERSTDTGGTASAGDDGLPAWVPLAGLAGAGLLAVGLLWLRGLWLARRHRADSEAEVAELERALRRMGYDLPPGTTLTGIERRLARIAGGPAAVYVEKLRDRRYGPARTAGPSSRDRRNLRRGLVVGSGPLGRLKAWVALPPRPDLR